MDWCIERREFFRKINLTITVIILAVLLFIFMRYNVLGSKAEIIYNGEVIDTLNLNYNIGIMYNVSPEVAIDVSDGKIRFIASDCPDKICVKTGYIQYLGESAACLPNKMIIRVIKGSENPVDAVSK